MIAFLSRHLSRPVGLKLRCRMAWCFVTWDTQHPCFEVLSLQGYRHWASWGVLKPVPLVDWISVTRPIIRLTASNTMPPALRSSRPIQHILPLVRSVIGLTSCWQPCASTSEGHSFKPRNALKSGLAHRPVLDDSSLRSSRTIVLIPCLQYNQGFAARWQALLKSDLGSFAWPSSKFHITYCANCILRKMYKLKWRYNAVVLLSTCPNSIRAVHQVASNCCCSETCLSRATCCSNDDSSMLDIQLKVNEGEVNWLL